MNQSGTTRNTSSNEEAVYIEIFRNKAEEKLGWGKSEEWSHNDYLELSEKVSEASGLNISVTTIKRVWGKLKYNGAPTITTLNALACFLEYESWRSFKIEQNDQIEKEAAADKKEHDEIEATQEKQIGTKASKIRVLFPIGFAALALLTLIFFISFKYYNPSEKVINKEKVLFNSEPVTTGLPNTVIFNYDVSSFDFDSAFIQQNWDPSRRQRIKKENKQLTSVYYYPGHFNAKLVVDNNIIMEHGLLIPTNGWLGFIDGAENNVAPTYFYPKELIKEGHMQADKSVMVGEKASTSHNFFITYSNAKDFGLNGDDFTLETTIKNSLAEGGLTCQQSYIYLDGESGLIGFPVSALGCVGSIGLEAGDVNISGKNSDLSSFGADLNEWTKIKCIAKNKKVAFFINDRLVYTVAYKEPIGKIMGINFNFHGAGAVDFVRLYDGKLKLIYQDEF